MLDYFIQNGYLIIHEDGSFEKSATCPKIFIFKEDENGVIKVYLDFLTQHIEIKAS